MVKEKRLPQETQGEEEETKASITNIRGIMEETKNYEDVIGYILRNPNSAAIDLKDPTKIIEYAIFSSSTIEAAEELSKLFNLGAVQHSIIEGKNAKVIFLSIGESKISIFIENSADCEKILKKLNPTQTRTENPTILNQS